MVSHLRPYMELQRKNSYLLTVADLYYLLYGKIVHFLLINKKNYLLYGAKRGCSTNSMASRVMNSMLHTELLSASPSLFSTTLRIFRYHVFFPNQWEVSRKPTKALNCVYIVFPAIPKEQVLPFSRVYRNHYSTKVTFNNKHSSF
jgi:hypothetical protein